MSNGFRTIEDCPYHDRSRSSDAFCPRQGKMPGYCNADSVPEDNLIDKVMDCERFLCHRSEQVIDILYGMLENIKEYASLKEVELVDGNKKEVLMVTDFPSGSNIYTEEFPEKRKTVIDEEGVMYLPEKDNPELYHPNRTLADKAIIQLKQIFGKLKTS